MELTAEAAGERAPDSAASSAPTRMGHLVLSVRDLERSHRFWTEVVGFEQSGVLDHPEVSMRFYRGSPDHHHDLALMQVWDVEKQPPAPDFDMSPRHIGVNHIAIIYTPDAWRRRVALLDAMNVEIVQSTQHGMSRSVYIADPDGNGVELYYDFPDEAWRKDVNAALNYASDRPRSGRAAAAEHTDVPAVDARPTEL